MNEVNDSMGHAADTAYLDSLIGFQLRCAQLAVFRDIIASFGEIPVTVVQFSAMCVIKDNSGITQAELASAIEVDRPRIVPVLDMMEERGWTERRTAKSDRRMRRIYLTGEGERVLAELQDRFDEHQERMKARIGAAELDALKKTLGKLSGRHSSGGAAGDQTSS